MPTFGVDSSQSDIKATTEASGALSKSLNLAMSLGIGIYVFVRMLPLVSALQAPYDSDDVWNWIAVTAMFFFGAAIVWTGVRQIFPEGESLECDGKTLKIGKIPSYAFTGTWKYASFPIVSVKQITYTTLRISRYGGVNGLSFRVEGKEYKVLYGLESPEASVLLQALTKFGVDTVLDVGMPMMVEMALARRKSRWRWFLP